MILYKFSKIILKITFFLFLLLLIQNNNIFVPRTYADQSACALNKTPDACNYDFTNGCYWGRTSQGTSTCLYGTRGPSCGAQVYCPQGYSCDVANSKCNFVSCSNIADTNSCNSTAGCFWTVNSNSQGYCESGEKGSSCGAQVYCPQGRTCDVANSKCNFVSCESISSVNSCNLTIGCFWHLSNSVSNKGECVTDPQGPPAGANIYCRPNEIPDISKGLCISNNSSSNNTCRDVDNDDGAFKCLSSCEIANGNPSKTYSSATSNTGNYSCGSTGGVCCRNDSIYGDRKLGSGGPGANPTTPVGGTTPGAGTPVTTPKKSVNYACEFRDNQSYYIGSFCGNADGTNPQAFDPTKAAARAFCGLTYIDQYKCNDGTIDNFTGTTPKKCDFKPWCPSSSTTTPTPTDSPTCQGLAQTCGGVITCCKSQNLECKAQGIVKTCQYIGGVAFTPTPGAPSGGDCKTQIANYQGSVGCACPDGNGCGPNVRGCFPAVGGSLADKNTWFCSSGPSTWCEKSQTIVPNAAACGTAVPYNTPTPTPIDLGYQADCPDNGLNACVLGTTCPAGYKQHSNIGTPGGTDGNKVCTEFEGGRASACCTKEPTTTGPVITSAPTPIPTTTAASVCPDSTTEQCQQEPVGSVWGCLTGWTETGKTCTSPAVCCKAP